MVLAAKSSLKFAFVILLSSQASFTTNSSVSSVELMLFFKDIDFFSCVGVTDKTAHVPQVHDHEVISASVAISTLPATVVLALGVDPASTSAHAPEIYCWRTPSAVL